MDVSLIVAEAPLDILREAGTLISALPDCRSLSGPALGMYAMIHRERVCDQPFILGELLVTSAEAEVNGEIGYSCVLGDEPERARFGAIIDAALRTDHERSDALARVLERAGAIVKERHNQEKILAEATRVEFDVRPN